MAAKNDDAQNKRITEHAGNTYWHETTHDNTATTYASGDVIGTVGQLDVPGDGGGGIIRAITVVSTESQAAPLRIHFFRRAMAAAADDAAFAPSREVLRKHAGYIDINAGDYLTFGTLRFAYKKAANIDFSVPGGRLYYVVEARGAPVWAAANALDINFGNWPD
jgi:hypothetical protein